jgi:hypothetical protein
MKNKSDCENMGAVPPSGRVVGIPDGRKKNRNDIHLSVLAPIIKAAASPQEKTITNKDTVTIDP